METYDALRETLQAFPEISLAVLFGSTARGTAGSTSDVDLAVWLDTEAVNRLWDIDLAAGAAMRRPVDLVDLRRAPPLLRLQIARHGIVLVEAEPGRWSRFKAQAMIDWWDWAPTARMMQRITVERLRQEADRGRA